MNIKIWKQSYKEQFFAKNLKKNRILIISPSKIEKDTFKKNMTNHNKYYFLSSKQILIQSLIYFKFDLKIFIKILKIFLSRLTFSVGLTFVMYLIMLNFRPTLFGFDLKENMKNRSHYFEKAGKPGKRHNLELEHKILKELQRRNLLYINH